MSESTPSTTMKDDESTKNENELEDSGNAPPDKYNLVYIIFFIQGIGMLLPWNFFITANDYFRWKFKENQTIQEKFMNVFAISAMVPNVLSLLLNIYLTSKMSSNSRIIPSLVLMFLGFLVTTVFVWINTHAWVMGFFILTVIIVILNNMGTGIFQGAIFGVAGIVGQKYTHGLMMGQAWAGIFAAMASIITQAGDGNVQQSGFAYFLIAAIVILVSLVSYCGLFRLPLMKYCVERVQKRVEKENTKTGKKLDVDTDEATPLLARGGSQSVPYWQIFKQIAPLCFSVAYIFVVTLALFPAIVGNIRSVNESSGSKWTTTFFSPLVCFLVFNGGDLIGRIMAGRWKLVSAKGWGLPFLVIGRTVLIPLFMMCNFQPRYHSSVTFNNDYAPAILNVLFSVSNGYLGSLCMMYGPQQVPLQHAETAGTIMAFFLTAGLFVGSLVSFGLVELI